MRSGGSSSNTNNSRFYVLYPVFKVGAQPPTLSIDLSQASITEGNSGQDRSTVINYRMSKGHSAQFLFLACVDRESSTATFRTASDGKAADFNLVTFVTYANVVLNAEGGKCRLYNYPANTTNQKYRLSVLGDTTTEGNETAVVTIKRDSGTPDAVVLGTASATLTINNDDGTPPVITITGGSAVTEGTAASFTVNANPAPSGNLTVQLNVSDDDTSDFVASGNEGAKTVTIPASQASATYAVATEQGSTDEPNGEVTVEVTASDGYTVDSSSSAMVTVNDVVAVKFSSATYSVPEGDAVKVGVTLSETRSSATAIPIQKIPISATGSDVDFDTTSRLTITVPAGQTSATETVQTMEDNHVEGNETSGWISSAKICPPG